MACDQPGEIQHGATERKTVYRFVLYLVMEIKPNVSQINFNKHALQGLLGGPNLVV